MALTLNNYTGFETQGLEEADGVIGSPAKASLTRIREADDFADQILPQIEKIQADGIKSLRGIARELNAMGVETARGGMWYASTVKNVFARTEQAQNVKGGISGGI